MFPMSCAWRSPTVQGGVDIARSVSAMELAVARAVAALENTAGAYSDFHRANMQTVLRSMLSTHRAIRKVLGWGEEDPMSVDALALARLPLEGLYTICLMTEDASWVDCYLKDGW